jgi:hypothetical protein
MWVLTGSKRRGRWELWDGVTSCCSTQATEGLSRAIRRPIACRLSMVLPRSSWGEGPPAAPPRPGSAELDIGLGPRAATPINTWLEFRISDEAEIRGPYVRICEWGTNNRAGSRFLSEA